MKKLVTMALATALIPMIGSAVDRTFTGTGDITNAANWDVAVPVWNSTIADRLNFYGTTTYTAAQGDTVLADSGRAFSINSGGYLTITGGSLTAAGGSTGFIGDNSAAATTLEVSGGSFTAAGTSGDLILGGRNDFNANLIVNGGAFSTVDDLFVGGGLNSTTPSTSTSTVTVTSGSVNIGDDLLSGTANNDAHVFNLNVSGGAMTVDQIQTYNTMNVNLTGGTLTARQFRQRDAADAATITFDGGTLKAANSATDRLVRENIDVIINSGGATIDTSGGIQGFSAAISGAGNLTVNGAGELVLEADSAFSGATSLASGTTLSGGGSISNSAVTLSGGLINAGGNVGWTSALGTHKQNLIGELTLGSLDGTGTLVTEYDGESFDLLTVIGDLDISNLSLDMVELGAVSNGTYTIATFGSLTGSDFASVDTVFDSDDWSYSVNANDITVTVIPEPATVGLVAMFGVGMLFVRRHFKI